MSAGLCSVCHLHAAHPQYGDVCEDCYANAQSYLTRPFDRSLYNLPRIKNSFKEQALDEPVSILELGTRIENSLSRNAIHSIRNLIVKTKEELKTMRHIGKAAVAEIEIKLQQIGFTLRESQLQKS